MFSTKAFQDWGKEHAVLFAAVMTRIEGRAHDALLRTYGFRGFPSLAVLDADGTMLVKNMPRDLWSMRNRLRSAEAFAAMEAAREAGEPVDGAEWFLARLDLGEVDLEAARQQLETLELDDAQRARAEQHVLVLQMSKLQAATRPRRGRPGASLPITLARSRIYEAFRSGRRLPEGAPPQAFVDEQLLLASETHDDREAFLHVYPRVRAATEASLRQSESALARVEEMAAGGTLDDQRRQRLDRARSLHQHRIDEAEARIAALDRRKAAYDRN